MKKRILAVLVLCCMVLTMLSACGIEKKGDDTTKDREDITKNREEVLDDDKEDITKKLEEASDDDNEELTKKDIDEALENIEDSDVELDPDLVELLENIDEDELEAAYDTNKAMKVTADFPEGWEIDEDSSMMLSAQSGVNILMVTNMYWPGVKDARDLSEKNIEKDITEVKKFFEDAEFSDVQDAKIAGYDGAWYSIDINITKNMTQRQEYFFFYKDGNAYMIQGAYMMGDEEAANEVHEVMNSLKFEEQ